MHLTLPNCSVAVTSLIFSLLVSSCGPEPAEFGQCTPGVEDISRTANVCP